MLALILVGLGIVGVGVSGGWLLVHKSREAAAEQAKWRPIPGTPMTYRSFRAEDEARLTRWFKDLEAMLETIPLFRGRVWEGLNGKRLNIRSTETWMEFGVRVAGSLSADSQTMNLGPSLAAGGHEGVHMLQLRFTAATDNEIVEGKGHPTWVKEIYPAIATYDARWPAPKA